MLSPEEKKLIQEFNSNVRWLRQKELKEECTASAADVMKITGWTQERLRGERKRKSIRFKEYKTEKGKRFRYDLSSLPEVYRMLKKTTILSDSATAQTAAKCSSIYK
jgi:hypothetical protein